MENKKNVKYHRICFVAGKSGGHILPCITLAQQMLNKHPQYEVMFFSTATALDKQLVNSSAIIRHYIPLTLQAFPHKSIVRYPKFLWHLVSSFVTSFYYLYKLKPEGVISTGGHISIPVCLAARLLKIPIELYELNVIPGKAIKFLAPFAYKIWICFEQSTSYFPGNRCTLTNYPMKFTDYKKLSREDALATIQFSPQRKTVVILGGSQGSLFINAAMRQTLENFPQLAQNIQIIHQTGAYDTTDWQSFYASMDLPALVFSYSDELATYYAAADIVMCRSGAGTLAEVSFFDKPCITIPLETATTKHQVDNAVAAAQTRPDLFTIVKQEDIDQDRKTLHNAITSLL
ncbi:MAG: UDP-N-acetylglucosamine--N-acetylmuramyl-(pentapeptide) pyrophosphoryl-undecaprenol N-acetylglucosamine transferase [Candidatus Dependentiae bacterium]|nr:UDP-N-acetylglucosamine--N-acetylmuramyl-(pentapeptide) pyrophosphoryl-undecaprenol N-acetylglucosamine transferase [Candidatus Dependentiae bacterium]